MTSITRNLLIFTIAFTFATAISAQTAAVDAKVAVKAMKAEKSKSFCAGNNWSNNDRVSVSDLREITLPASGSINVDGRTNGGISVKGEDRGDILVRACVQSWGITEEAARAAAANVKIATAGIIQAENSGGEKDFSVSYQIHVPRSTSLLLKAHNGGISISGVDGTSQFETTNGGLNIVDAGGKVTGRTANGGVNVVLSGNSWKGAGLDVQTTNGGVMVKMPENYAAQFETATVNGGFTTDIRGLEQEKPAERGSHRATKINTSLNGGGAPVRVVTTNGGVRVVTLAHE